jgi:hypothetical protein
MMRVFAVAAAATITPAAAQNFSCSNKTAEIRCASGACQIATEGYTPMALSRRGKTLEICAYSGCYQGAIAFQRMRGGVTHLYARVKRDGGNEVTPLSVLYDAAGKTAQLRWEGFSSAMICAN